MTAATSSAPLLEVRDLHAWYGELQVLRGLDFDVAPGEVVTLVGRNGAGKTTTLKSIMGLMRRRTGQIRFEGADISALVPEAVAARGIGWCPEDRGIFTRLTVKENLLLPPIVRDGGMSLSRIFELFPNLRPRLGNPGAKLSGGEQQMLAIARILRTGARLLLLDEPTEGLAPVIIRHIGSLLKLLRADGYTVVLVEQNLAFVGRLADRHYVMEGGRVVDTLSKDDLARRRGQVQSYLGV